MSKPGTGYPVAVGVDIGGTKINVGLMNQVGDILVQRTLPALAAEGKVMAQALRGIQEVLEQAAERHAGHPVVGIGIGSAGQIDHLGGKVIYASDLIPGYTGTPIRDIVSAQFHLPVHVDNDVNVLALAEKQFGAGRQADPVICLALGTGVGGAILVGGRILHGFSGSAGELGHIPVDFRGPRCVCGNYGCLELYASGTGIARIYRERTGQAEAGSVPVDAREVMKRWLSGETAAGDVMAEAIAALGAGIAGLIHTFNPQKVVIGGGIAEAGEPILRRLREEARLRTMPAIFGQVEIVSAIMGNRSGMIGAAWQVWEYGSSWIHKGRRPAPRAVKHS